MAYVDPSDELLTGLYTLMNNQLSYSGTVYPFFTLSPDRDYNYVYVQGLDLTENATKDVKAFDMVLTIEIVTAHKKRGSFKLVNDLSNQVMDLIFNTGITMTNFHFWELPSLGTSGQFAEETEQQLILRKQLVFNFRIGQN